eukprot:7002722-Prymnesium_polylepis.1
MRRRCDGITRRGLCRELHCAAFDGDAAAQRVARTTSLAAWRVATAAGHASLMCADEHWQVSAIGRLRTLASGRLHTF